MRQKLKSRHALDIPYPWKRGPGIASLLFAFFLLVILGGTVAALALGLLRSGTLADFRGLAPAIALGLGSAVVGLILASAYVNSNVASYSDERIIDMED